MCSTPKHISFAECQSLIEVRVEALDAVSRRRMPDADTGSDRSDDEDD